MLYWVGEGVCVCVGGEWGGGGGRMKVTFDGPPNDGKPEKIHSAIIRTTMWPIMSPSFHIAGGKRGKSTCSAGNKEDTDEQHCALAALEAQYTSSTTSISSTSTSTSTSKVH